MSIRQDELVDGRRALEAAPRGGKAQVITALAHRWGISEGRVREHLRAVGWESGRKRRADAGQSKITEDELRLLATEYAMGERKSGKMLGDIGLLKRVLYRSGKISQEAFEASDTTWAKQLHLRGWAKTQLSRPSLATEMDARRPNDWHVVDASIGVLFYVDSKGKMKFKQLNLMDPKNKPEAFARHVSTRLLLVRWVLVDYYSSAMVVDYREASGEKATDLVDFLHYAWSPKPDRRWPMFGVPRGLLFDQGAPQKSSYITSLCEAFEIRTLFHESSDKRADAAAARASGVVEVAHNIWENEFEAQWRFSPPTGGLAQIREQAADFCVTLNSSPEFKLSRIAQTRSQLWMHIRDDEIRVPPADLDAFRKFAYGAEESRVLDGYGRVSWEGATYKIEHCRWMPEETVWCRRMAFDDGCLLVRNPRTGETLEAFRQGVRANGRSTSAAYIGEAEERTAGTPGAHQPLHSGAKIKVETAKAMAEKTGLAAPGALDPGLGKHADGVLVEFAPRVGTPIFKPVSGRRVDSWDVLDLAVARFGRALEKHESEWLTSRVEGRIDETHALELIEELAQGQGLARQVLTFGRSG